MFFCSQTDEVVKVGMLCGPGGDGAHAEKVPFSFTMGQMRRRRRKEEGVKQKGEDGRQE